MAYLALYRLDNPLSEPDALCFKPRVFDSELEVVCDNVLCQEGYQGWCTAKVVHDPDDYEDFEYLVNLDVPFSMYPEEGTGEIRLKLMASRASKKREARGFSGEVNEGAGLGEALGMEGSGEVNEGAGLGEALGMEGIAEKTIVIDYAKRAPTLTIGLEARATGALAQYSAKNGEFEVKRRAIRKDRRFSKRAREEEEGLVALEQMVYTSGLLGELALDLVLSVGEEDANEYSDEEVTAITERHLRFMNLGDMQALVMGMIMGEEPDTKKAEALNDQVNLNIAENLKDLTGTEPSQVLPDTINLPPNTSDTSLVQNNSLNTSEKSPNGNTGITSVQPSLSKHNQLKS